jgi:hypothetical protein
MAKPFEVSQFQHILWGSDCHIVQGKETEHNWAAREQSIQRVRGMLKGDIHQRYPDVFMASLKDGFMQWSLKTVMLLLNPRRSQVIETILPAR